MNIRARALSTVRDSTSQKFLLLGQLSRQESTPEGRFAAIFLDFAPMGRRKCSDADYERWYARTVKNKECLMGHKVFTPVVKEVYIRTDKRWDSNGTSAARLARTATSAKNSQTPWYTKRIVHAKMTTTNGTLRRGYHFRFLPTIR